MADQECCRVCGSQLDHPILDLAAPALTTANQQIDAPTRLYVCTACAHVQSPELPSLADYYDTNYKISLGSEEHDQLYEMRGCVPVYRTDRQAEVVLEKTPLPNGARVLDYGAAKASTLRKIATRRPDLVPHAFDVSEDYHTHWSSWLSEESTATYRLPDSWQARFDLVTAHYVVEHVPDPASTLRELSGLLAPGGRIFFSVPDWTTNTGDLLCADHINHFTRASLQRLLCETGLVADDIDAAALPSAFTVACRISDKPAPSPSKSEIGAAVLNARETAHALERACGKLDHTFAANNKRRTAVYGAGFYGAFLLTRMAGRIPVARCLDNNRHLWGTNLFDVPVGAPDTLPKDVDVVYVGLNPARARAIAATVPALQRPGLDLFFIDLS